MKQYIILHNQHDEKSRQFVKSLPMFSLDRVCVLDWYGDQKERWSRSCLCHFMQPYFGPPPSEFPVIATRDEQGVWGAIQSASHPDDRHEQSAYFFETEHGACLGGQWTDGIPELIARTKDEDPQLAQIIESAYRTYAAEQKNVNGKVLK